MHLKNIKCSDKGIPLVVFNSLAWEQTDIVDHIVSIEKQGIRELTLTDEKGSPIASQIKTLATYPDGSMARAEVIFEAPVPSLGYATFYLAEGKNKTVSSLTASATMMETHFLKCKLIQRQGESQAFTIKQTGKNSAVTIQGPEAVRYGAKVSIIEEKLNDDLLSIEKNKVKDVPVGKFAIETLRLNFK